MAGGAFAAAGGGDEKHRGGGKLTVPVVITCVVAASGGLIFGYDIGISGGVTTMPSFLRRFFPEVLKRKGEAKRDEYCVYDSQALTAFTSSLYLAALLASLAAAPLSRAFGRRTTMLLGGTTFLSGSAINGAAINVEMLILGRILLGLGVGFTTQATPIYLSEMAPSRYRGALNTGFQLFIGIGVVAANLINYATSRIADWGWRLSLGLAAAPAAVMLVGALFIPDTPASLVLRGKESQALAALRRVRGPGADVEAELADLVRVHEDAKSVEVEWPFRTILKRRYRPHLVMSLAIPMFQQLTGINVIAFYAPVLFQTVGFGSNPALMAAVILGGVNLVSILVSTVIVDRYGRRILFIQGGAQMIICQVAVAWVLGAEVGPSGSTLPETYSKAVLALLCVYAAGFGWSWGPLSWLVPSEIFPAEIRAAGQSITVAVNFAVTFSLAQTFLAMLCAFKFGAFLFYAAWITAMTAFVAALLPETKEIPLESMHRVWEEHWFWRRFVLDKNQRSFSTPLCKS